MKKVLFIASLLVSMNSLNAMDNGKRCLALGGALVYAIGGNTLANKIHASALNDLKSRSLGNNQNVQEKKKKFLYKSALSGAVRSSSWISAMILGRYTINGSLPDANPQTYASLLAVAAGGALCQSGFALECLNRQGSPKACTLIFGGGALALAGTYGVLKS